jgi:hypothetical protein
LSLDVRFVMLATDASDGSGREEAAGVGLLSGAARRYPVPVSEEVAGDMGGTVGTPGENRLTWGARAEALAEAEAEALAEAAACCPAPAAKDHVSALVRPPCAVTWRWRYSWSLSSASWPGVASSENCIS